MTGFWSADGPYGEVSAENYGQPGFVAYRNPLVAEAMRVLNLVQRWGTGLPIARRELRANQPPAPLFRVTPSGSSVPFKHEIATDVDGGVG